LILIDLQALAQIHTLLEKDTSEREEAAPMLMKSVPAVARNARHLAEN